MKSYSKVALACAGIILVSFSLTANNKHNKLFLEPELVQYPASYLQPKVNNITLIFIALLKKYVIENRQQKSAPETKIDELPWIYVITPTRWKYEQKADLTRLAQTLAHVKHLWWIVIEDRVHRSHRVARLLQRSHVTKYTHLAVPTPFRTKGRGMTQRNLALQFLRQLHNSTANSTALPSNGVVYFADDDNTYDLRLFHEHIRNVTTVGVWPVGLVGGSLVETPIVADGHVTGWDVSFGGQRRFAIDMAGFGVHLDLILSTNARFHSNCTQTEFESCFLTQLGVSLNQLEPFGCDSEEVLVWHTRTVGSGRTGGDKGFDV